MMAGGVVEVRFGGDLAERQLAIGENVEKVERPLD
jgi:hypothetical protein